jgi:signal transduction histidine kinase
MTIMTKPETSPDDTIRKLRHDIKGCLNSLVLSAEVLCEDLEPDEAAEFLDGMARAADKMSVLLEQIAERQPDEPSEPA